MSGFPSWAKVGAKVVFLGHRNRTGGHVILLNAGEVYTIRELFRNSMTGEPGVRLCEVTNTLARSGKELGYPLVSFRPVIEPKSEAEDLATFRKWLRVDQPQGEDA